MSRPLLLDLFCCEGGAAMGYHRAGFDVVGVDIEPQPRYPFPFVQADALRPPLRLEMFDAIHASPPCQGYTPMTNRHPSKQPRLIPHVRALLQSAGVPYVIENVRGSGRELRESVRLSGEMFGLRVHRPRLFESNVLLLAPPMPRPQRDPAAVYGKRPDHRHLWTRKDGTQLRAATEDVAREAMGMPWASWNGLREGIPPAYTEHVGRQLLAYVEAAA